MSNGYDRQREMERVIDLAHQLISACDVLGENTRLASLANAAERISAELSKQLTQPTKQP